MFMTERLYYTDSHLTEFTGRVICIADAPENRFVVTLDRTAFYPTGGGQPFDTGTIGAARVVDCTSDEADLIRHIIEGEPPQTGDEVNCRIDWPRRLDHLQQHTAQHILSRAFVKLFRAETRGFRMMEEYSEIDVALESPTDARVAQAILLANEIVWQNRPVRIHFSTADEAAQIFQDELTLRKRSNRGGKLRIIEIADFDANSCGGTHAQATGEVGSIVVRAWERAKGMTRIEFLAGGRALRDYARANQTAREAAAMLGRGRDNVAEGVGHLIEENKNLVRRTRALEETALRVEAEELFSKAKLNSENPCNLRIVAYVFAGRDVESLKRLALMVIANSRAVALFGSIDGEAARLIFARASDLDGDMNVLMRESCLQLGGRGGGRADFAQGGGRAQSAEHLAETIEAAQRRLEAESNGD